VPLPDGGPWPPANLAPVTERLCAWSAWYSGNPDELEYVYGTGYGWGYDSVSNNRIKDHPSQYRGGVVGRFARWFWGEPNSSNQKRSKLHVPIASDIATTSADLLFSEPPTITPADEKDTTTQDRIEQLIDDGMHASLLESGEVGAALGGSYLRVCWDADVKDKPWLSVQHADAAVPEWRWSMLSAVTFWRELHRDDKQVIRHLERHEPGVILHGLYDGTPENLGKPIGLGAYPETRDLQPVIDTGIPYLTASYVPNMLPNRLWRSLPAGAPMGRSDYASSEPLFDALDETYSSWMRDIRIGKGRLIVPETYLQDLGVGKGAGFDADREVWEGLNMLGSADRNQLTVAQFAIRVAEHKDTSRELIGQILRNAGYSEQTFGIGDELAAAVTATEVSARERKSNITRDKKIVFCRPGLQDAIRAELAIDAVVFNSGVTPDRPNIDFGDVVSEDPQVLAQTAQLLRAAEAASTKTIVQLVNPDWDDERVDQEVAAIEAEKPVMDLGGFGPGAEHGPAEPSMNGDRPTAGRAASKGAD
jgi:A118 family predicted phage portal protein